MLTRNIASTIIVISAICYIGNVKDYTIKQIIKYFNRKQLSSKLWEVAMKTKLIKFLKDYIEWDNNSILVLDDDINLYIADTLPQAWLLARPYDKKKFENNNFYNMVNCTNGKWLEPTNSNEPYSVILASKNYSFENILCTFAHELQHCMDYITSVEHFGENKENMYCDSFAHWSEFRAEFTRTRVNAYLNKNNLKNGKTAFKFFTEFLGYKTSDALVGLVKSDTADEKMYYISRYMGCQRAVRNLSDIYCPNPVFQLWNLTPDFITDKYGYGFFYLENTWENIKVHDLYKHDKEYLELKRIL